MCATQAPRRRGNIYDDQGCVKIWGFRDLLRDLDQGQVTTLVLRDGVFWPADDEEEALHLVGEEAGPCSA
jgi:hypothetical protein